MTHKNINKMKNIHKINQNIYITSDEEIKEGDWVIDNNGLLAKVITELTWHFINYKKIILTTDQSLDGVQAIDDDFLEWFVKNPTCESVVVNYELGSCLNCEWNHDMCPNVEECLKSKYNIIIPKEEPKDVVLGYKTSENFYYGTDEFGTYRKIYYKDKEQTLYTEEQVREALFYALNVNRTTCCTTRTTDSIVRETIQSLKPKKD
jgi:hypothetical protein